MRKLLSKGIKKLKKKIKKSCAALFSFIFRAHSFRVFGIPYGLAESEENCEEIYPKPIDDFPLPKTISSHLIERFSIESIGNTAGLLFLKNGVATSKGGNLSKEGKLVTTYLQPLEGKPPHEHALFHFSTKRFFPKIFVAKEPVVSLAAGWQSAFYHWMYEVLPRLHLIEKKDYHRSPLFLENLHPFQRESLALLDIEENRIINCKDFQAVNAPQIIVPSINERPTKWGCEYLRTRFLPKLAKKPKKRIYVSRQDASKRRIINEEEVFAYLKTLKYEKVLLAHLSLKEQMEIFLNAEMIIGPHGAGFSHLVFCDPATKIVEFFSPHYLNCCYWHVAGCVSLDYCYLLGEEHGPSGEDPDIVIDLAKLKKSLDLMHEPISLFKTHDF